jgi:hypothetical protein
MLSASKYLAIATVDCQPAVEFSNYNNINNKVNEIRIS